MLFLFFTEVSLVCTIVFVSLRFNKYTLGMEQMYNDNDGLWLYYIPKYIPDIIYKEEVIMGIKIGTIAVCGLFVLPLLLLIMVQVKNFCSAQTTNERFSRRKPKVEQENNRNSSSSSGSLNGRLLENDDEESNNKIKELPPPKRGCLGNCWDM